VLVSTAQLLIMIVIAIVVTLPAVWLIPKARQSPMFDRFLWAGTWAMAFLGAWYALGNLTSNLASVNVWVIGDVAVIPALIGAAVSAVFLNGLLWTMDRFASAPADEYLDEAEPMDAPNPTTAVSEEGNDGTDAVASNQQ
jgi:hypothetical protein